MKLGCCSWSYHRAIERGTLTIGQWLTLCAGQLGVEGVDLIAEQLRPSTPQTWRDVKKRCADLQLTIVSLSPSTDFGKPTALGRRRQITALQRWIEAASLLGAPLVRIFAGWAPADQRAARWSAMVGCIRQCARQAAQAGVTLAVEAHNHGGFISTSHEMLRLIRELDSPWVRINLDTGNYDEPDPYKGFARSLPWTAHVVAKVLRMRPNGEAMGFDYGRIVRLLKRGGYRGFVTLEYEGPADEARAVPQALAMLRRHGAAHGL